MKIKFAVEQNSQSPANLIWVSTLTLQEFYADAMMVRHKESQQI
jgi:hypothetical protein